MTPVENFRRWHRVLLLMRVRRWLKDSVWYVFFGAMVVGLCLQCYMADKTAGQERMMKILVPHLCMPADPDAAEQHRT